MDKQKGQLTWIYVHRHHNPLNNEIKVTFFHYSIPWKNREAADYSSTISLTSALEGVVVQRHFPGALPPGKSPATHCTGGWVDLKPACTVQTNESLNRLSYPGPSSNIYLRGKYFEEEALWWSTSKTFYVTCFFCSLYCLRDKDSKYPRSVKLWIHLGGKRKVVPFHTMNAYK
jgi:hypothetical protein